MDERRDWIKDRVELLEHSAADPLGPEGTFWQEAEDPWQCLAVCKEITNARASGDPTTYMCRLPVHQDGSCNGLQHYAALGRDEAGGEQVNLMPRDRPGDVYTGKGDKQRPIIQSNRIESNRIVVLYSLEVKRLFNLRLHRGRYKRIRVAHFAVSHWWVRYGSVDSVE